MLTLNSVIKWFHELNGNIFCDVNLPLTIHVAFSHSPLSKQIIVGGDALYPTEQLTTAEAPNVVLLGTDSDTTPLSIVLSVPQSAIIVFNILNIITKEQDTKTLEQ